MVENEAASFYDQRVVVLDCVTSKDCQSISYLLTKSAIYISLLAILIEAYEFPLCTLYYCFLILSLSESEW